MDTVPNSVNGIEHHLLPPQFKAPLAPFLKWPGGKRWLIASHPELLKAPSGSYIEPFLGGGAVFFWLEPERALLADLNQRLIDCYGAIKNQWREVWGILKRHQRLHKQSYYYDERSRRRRSQAERAAQFIYLNRTCWNGLYRVNLDGEFNVPIGTKSSVVFDTDDFERIAERLARVELCAQDFEQTIAAAGPGDFVFADPPYTVRHDLNGFLKYNENIFSWEDQMRLHTALLGAKSRGARILLMNANHSSVRELFKDLGEIRALNRASVLAADSSFRGSATELAILSEPG
jgi:DNA adenine methylase